MWTRAHVAWPGPKRQRAGAFQDAGAPPPDRGLSQTASHRQTDPHQNHSIRHSFIRLLRVGTTRAPEHRHADLKIRRVIPRSKFDLPRSSTPNCHWPPGWDLAGERARPGCRFRRRAVRFPNYPQRRQARHICRTKTKMNFSPVGAAYSARTPDDVAPDGALALGGCDSTNMSALTGFAAFASFARQKNQTPTALIVHPKLAWAVWVAGSLLGSATVPVAVSGVAPKNISNPNGIPSISPALTRSGYAGFTSPQTTNNPNGVASTSRRNLIQPLQG
jgi:hypothetical protein